jgi:hypothetical protein
MRRIGFWIGIALVVFAAATAFAQLLSWVLGASAATVNIGSLWAGIHARSLFGFQGFVENRLSSTLWPSILWVLLLPAWVSLGVLGLLLLPLGRRRGRGFD